MSAATGTILRGLKAIVQAFAPLEDLLADAARASSFLVDLGARAPAVPPSLLQLRPLVRQLSDALAAVDALLGAGDETSPQVLEKIGDLGSAAASLFGALHNLPQQLEADLAAYPDLLAEVDMATLVERLAARFLIEYLRGGHAAIYNALVLSGLLEVQVLGAGVQYATPTTHYAIRADRLGDLFTNPAAALADVYGWNTATFDHRTLLLRLSYLLLSLGFPGTLARLGGDPPADSSAAPALDAELDLPIYSEMTDDAAATLDAVVLPTIPAGGGNAGLELTASGTGNVSASIELDPGLVLKLGGDFTSTGAIGVAIEPPFQVEPVTGGGPGNLETAHVQADLSFQPSDGSRIPLLNQPGLLALDLGGFASRVAVTAGTGPGAVLAIEVRALGGELAIGAGDGDGFLQKILPSGGIQAPFELGLGWNNKSGPYFLGSGGFEIQLPVSIDLAGAVHVSAVVVSLQFGASGAQGTLTCSAEASLGPLAASVDRVGAALVLEAARQGGNLGPLAASVRFQPPAGVGLSLDSGIITGGGYLSSDPDRGLYAGALELVVADWLGLHAIGLITTKLPDGSSGFSLLIIITADFGPGIELGFGFTLLAVGGLLGLNRSMSFQPLLDGVRTGAINSIMFPQDIVANSARIISDLNTIFPPQEGTFLIGPMARLGWGTPTLVSLSMAVIIEIPPGDIAILGVLALVLPDEDDQILVLQVNFAGVLEFDKKRLYFFASLFDSHLLFITLTGEMGFLFAYGNDSTLVLVVGGFYPQFNPPPLPFPVPKRITANIINDSHARIRCDAYFALTTGTAQFGAFAEYYFGFSSLSVSGHSSFDALLQFSPFHFAIVVSTAFSVKVFGVGVYGVNIDLALEGPTPWHAHGRASISLLFFSIGVHIDVTWGDNRSTLLPPIAVMPILTAELGKPANWRALVPDGYHSLVSLRKLDPSEAVFVLHPVGTLQISQRAVPLDLALDRVGNQVPSDANRFHLDVAAGGLVKTRDLQDLFAPGQFKNSDDATKLSEPAYAPQDSGIELSAQGTSYASGTAITRNVRYALTVIDTRFRRLLKRFFSFPGSLFGHFVGGASVAASLLSAARNAQLQPFTEKVVVVSETYVVARRADNTPFDPRAGGFNSKLSAEDFMQQATIADPTLVGQLHVLPQFEVAP
jgi:hypothetical protein